MAAATDTARSPVTKRELREGMYLQDGPRLLYVRTLSRNAARVTVEDCYLSFTPRRGDPVEKVEEVSVKELLSHEPREVVPGV